MTKGSYSYTHLTSISNRRRPQLRSAHIFHCPSLCVSCSPSEQHTERGGLEGRAAARVQACFPQGRSDDGERIPAAVVHPSAGLVHPRPSSPHPLCMHALRTASLCVSPPSSPSTTPFLPTLTRSGSQTCQIEIVQRKDLPSFIIHHFELGICIAHLCSKTLLD